MTVTVESEPLLQRSGEGRPENARFTSQDAVYGDWRVPQWLANRNSDISYGAMYPPAPVPDPELCSSPADSSGPKPRITFTWTNLNVYATSETKSNGFVSKGIFSKKVFFVPRKHILKNVSGVARPGEILAVMGASGAGKTTLMDALTLRSSPRLTVAGTRTLSGAIVKRPSHLFGVAAYVPQKDLFIGYLTVREHLTFQALLRMGAFAGKKEQLRRIQEVMDELGLRHRQDTVIGYPGKLKGLSGGEMKRLSFASEILTEPTILFCDEPTSGQDSFMARTTVDVLSKLARRGKTIVLTIHQPTSEVYSLFDRVLFMAEGRVAFLGSPQEAANFFSNIDAPCPPKYNPADFFVQLLAVVRNEENACRKRIHLVCDLYEKSEAAKEVAALSEFPPTDKGWSSRLSVVCSSTEVRALAPSWCTQFQALLWRSWLSIKNDRALVRFRFIQTLVVGALLGIMYYGQTLNQIGMTNLNGALFTSISALTFQNVMAVIKVFCSEQNVFRKEHMSGLYRLDTYFLAKTIAEIPVFTVLPCVYICVVYYTIGLYNSFSHFLMAAFILILISHVSTSYGYMISSICNNLATALAIGSPAVIPVLLFGGFFAHLDTIPAAFSWIQWISWFRYGNEALLVNQWKKVKFISCEDSYSNSTCVRTGNVVLEMYSFKKDNIPNDILGLVSLIIGFRLVAFLALYIKTRKHR